MKQGPIVTFTDANCRPSSHVLSTEWVQPLLAGKCSIPLFPTVQLERLCSNEKGARRLLASDLWRSLFSPQPCGIPIQVGKVNDNCEAESL